MDPDFFFFFLNKPSPEQHGNNNIIDWEASYNVWIQVRLRHNLWG